MKYTKRKYIYDFIERICAIYEKKDFIYFNNFYDDDVGGVWRSKG